MDSKKIFYNNIHGWTFLLYSFIITITTFLQKKINNSMYTSFILLAVCKLIFIFSPARRVGIVKESLANMAPQKANIGLGPDVKIHAGPKNG